MYPDLSSWITIKVDNMSANIRHHERMSYVGDAINFQGKPKWMSGILKEHLSTLMLWVWLEDNHVWERPVDHIHMNMLTELTVNKPMDIST